MNQRRMGLAVRSKGGWMPVVVGGGDGAGDGDGGRGEKSSVTPTTPYSTWWHQTPPGG